MGECGLDEVHERVGQEGVFRRQVRMATKYDRALILHLRGKGDTMSPILHRAIKILKEEKLEAKHPIHLHSFMGSYSEYRLWLRSFPRTIFGVSRLTVEHQPAWDFTRLADLRKVVLETDAPYIKGSHSHSLSVQARWLSSQRGIPVRAVLGCTASVAVRFYGLTD